MSIQLANQGDLNAFFDYLDQHLSENGRAGAGVFQPLSKEESVVSDALKERFSAGVTTPFGQQGWRRLWVSSDAEGCVNGHVDLRPHTEKHTQHRVLLGMGVAASARRQGLGLQLLNTAIHFCEEHATIEWLDLWVISSNAAALALYHKAGFNKLGEIADMFRIDGASYAYTAMTTSTQTAQSQVQP